MDKWFNIITKVNNHRDELCRFFKDDPVRPHIPLMWRVTCGNYAYVLLNETATSVCAVTCVTFCNEVPTDESYIIHNKGFNPNVAVFYTIWSYQKGCGRELILRACEDIKNTQKNINRFVTLSPPTETARKFHLSNGAIELRKNTLNNTINYEYIL